ncbi:UNVERIFIED_ORG: hypothetical protein [Escherichia phage CMSTMSU]
MKDRCIVFDCDEVLLDHIGSLGEYAKLQYDINPTTPYPLAYDLSEWFGVSRKKFKRSLLNSINVRICLDY